MWRTSYRSIPPREYDARGREFLSVGIRDSRPLLRSDDRRPAGLSMILGFPREARRCERSYAYRESPRRRDEMYRSRSAPLSRARPSGGLRAELTDRLPQACERASERVQRRGTLRALVEGSRLLTCCVATQRERKEAASTLVRRISLRGVDVQ